MSAQQFLHVYDNLHHVAQKIEVTSEEDVARHGRLYPPVALDLGKILACSPIQWRDIKWEIHLSVCLTPSDTRAFMQ